MSLTLGDILGTVAVMGVMLIAAGVFCMLTGWVDRNDWGE